MSERICDYYANQVREVAEEWDGQDTADLFLEILERTGEDVPTILEEARLRWFADRVQS